MKTYNIALALLLLWGTPCLAASGDYEGDGLSDLAYIKVSRSQDKTVFYIRRSSNPASIQEVQFSAAGDAYVSGRFYGGARSHVGIVRVDDLNSPLRWVIKDPNGSNDTRSFGLPGDRIPNQGDIDCDGTTDMIVNRVSSGNRVWYAKRSSDNQTVNTTFGEQADKTYVGDINGDGCDELILLRPSTYQWISRGFSQNNSQAVTVQWGLPGDVPLVPQDLNSDGIPDYAVARRVGALYLAYYRFGDSSSATDVLGSSQAVPMIGNYFGVNSLGWVHRESSSATQTTPWDSDLSFSFNTSGGILMRPDGTVVAADESGRVGIAGSGGISSCERFLNPNDGRSKNITYNPNNSRKKPKLILPSSYNEGVESVALFEDDELVSNCPRKTPNEHGNRPRYYCDKSIAETPNNVTFVITKTSSVDCIAIADPKRRYD